MKTSSGGSGSRPTGKKIFYATASVAALVLGSFGVGGYIGSSQGIGDNPAFRTIVRSPADYRLRSELVSFRSTDGIELKAWWLPNQQDNSTSAGSSTALVDSAAPTIDVILAHGHDENRSGMLSRAEFLVHHGYNVLDVDLRGHGESEGNYNTPGFREALDILGGVSYVRSRGEHGPIVAFGYSYGAVAALHAAARCADVDAVIADSAFITPDDILKNVANNRNVPLRFRLAVRLAQLPGFSRSADIIFRLRTGIKIDRDKASALKAVRQIHQQPILFISGAEDWLAPTRNTRRMMEESPTLHKELLVIPGADHNTVSHASPQLYESGVLQFLVQNVPKKAVPSHRPCQPSEL